MWSRPATHHLILVLDKELDTLDGGGAGLGDGSGDTSHKEIDCRKAHVSKNGAKRATLSEY